MSSEATTPWAPLLGSRPPQGRQSRLQGIVRGTQVTSVSQQPCQRPRLLGSAQPPALEAPLQALELIGPHALADGLVTGRCFHLPPASRLTELPEEISVFCSTLSPAEGLYYSLREWGGWGEVFCGSGGKQHGSSPMVGSWELREPPCPLSLCNVSSAGEEKRLASLEGLEKVQMDEEGNVAAHFRTFVKFFFSCLL